MKSHAVVECKMLLYSLHQHLFHNNEVNQVIDKVSLGQGDQMSHNYRNIPSFWAITLTQGVKIKKKLHNGNSKILPPSCSYLIG